MKDRKQKKESEEQISTTLNISEVARIFDVHVSTIRRWGEQGKIKSCHVGPRSEQKFRREDVAVAYLNRAIQKYLKGKSA